MVYYDVDGQTDGDGTRMFEYVSLFGALSSTFASDTYLVGGIFSADESYYAANSDGLDTPFPTRPDSPGSEAIKSVTSFRLVETNVWSATFSASPRHGVHSTWRPRPTLRHASRLALACCSSIEGTKAPSQQHEDTEKPSQQHHNPTSSHADDAPPPYQQQLLRLSPLTTTPFHCRWILQLELRGVA